jgi:hypothetical protein
MKISIKRIIEGKLTYPSWSSNAVYKISCRSLDKDSVLIYYTTSVILKRIGRIFPKYVELDPAFIWMLGFLKGEGANSKGKSNYRRFTLTNKNPALICFCLNKLHEKRFIDRTKLPDGAFHIIHARDQKGAISYWSRQLNVSRSKIKCFDDNNNTSKYGVCHLYLSDVLLRRVVDELSEYVLSLNI